MAYPNCIQIPNKSGLYKNLLLSIFIISGQVACGDQTPPLTQSDLIIGTWECRSTHNLDDYDITMIITEVYQASGDLEISGNINIQVNQIDGLISVLVENSGKYSAKNNKLSHLYLEGGIIETDFSGEFITDPEKRNFGKLIEQDLAALQLRHTIIERDIIQLNRESLQYTMAEADIVFNCVKAFTTSNHS